MANKCEITPDAIAEAAKNITSGLIDVNLDSESDTDFLNKAKEFIQNEFKTYSDKYNLTRAKSLIEGIFPSISRFSKLVNLGSDFFNVESLTNRLKDTNHGISFSEDTNVSTDIIETPTTNLDYKLKGNEFLADYYGSATNVQIAATKLFNKWLVNHFLLNRETGESIDSIEKLNQSIRELKQQLADNIQKYLESIGFQFDSIQLFDEENNYTKSFDVQKQKIWNELAVNSEKLNKLFDRSYRGDEPSYLQLNAFNSFVLLNNFDSYVKSVFGKDIQFSNFGSLDSKYQWAEKGKSIITTWRTSDNIDLAKETSGIIKLLINTTDKYSWKTGNKINGTISFTQYQSIIKRLKNMAFEPNAYKIDFNDKNNLVLFNIKSQLSKPTQDILEEVGLFANIINSITNNPHKYLPALFELISNKDFMKYTRDIGLFNKFIISDYDIILSLYKGIFNTSSDRTNSVAQINNDIFEEICQNVDTISPINFYQYSEDEDGNITVIRMLDLSRSNLKRSIENGINTKNSTLLGQYDIIKNTYRIKDLSNKESKHLQIEFTIPKTNLTIQVTHPNKILIKNGNTPISQLSGKLLSNEEILTFIERLTNVNLKNGEMYSNLLEEYNNSDAAMITDLVKFGSRILLQSHINNVYATNLTTPSAYKSFIASTYLDPKYAPKVNNMLRGLGVIIEKSDLTILNHITNATLNLTGLNSAISVKDSEGNTQSTVSPSRLLSNVKTQFMDIQHNPNSVMYNSLMTSKPELLKGIFNAKEFSGQEESKSHTKFSLSEMFYSQFVVDYIQGLNVNTDVKDKVVGDGIIGILPSENSDKPNIGRLLVDLNTQVVVNGQTKRLRDLTVEELRTFTETEFDNIYTRLQNKIKADWNALLGYNQKLTDALAGGASSYDELLANDFSQLRSNNDSAYNNMNKLIANYNSHHHNNPLRFIDQVHYITAKDGRLYANKTISYMTQQFKNPNFWEDEERKVAKNLLNSGFSVDLASNITNEKSNLSTLRLYTNWISDTGEMVIAKAITADGTVINIDKNNLELLDEYRVVLHPELQKYNLLNFLISEEWLISTVGTHAAHPSKYFGTDPQIDQAKRKKAQNKRNNGYTASMQKFQLGTKTGILSDVKIAVVNDINNKQYNAFGDTTTTKPWDGATFVSPAQAYLENNSLGTQKAGMVKKPFIQFYDASTGTGGSIKTAGFGLTNDWIRNSTLYQIMVKKMFNQPWIKKFTDADELLDINLLEYSKVKYPVYYKRNGKYFHLLNMESKGSNKYGITLEEVDSNGNTIKVFEEPEEVTIANDYDLYQVFGGAYSMDLVGKELQFSESSIKNLVEFMNNVEITDENGKTYQPLKESQIAYLVTAGAIKYGASNINSIEDLKSETKEYLNFFNINMRQSGIQLDKEHDADEAELSLMTQVWNACGLRGYTHEQASRIYNALAELSKKGTDTITEVLTQYFINPKDDVNAVYSTVNKIVLQALANSDKSNAILAIAQDIIREIKAGNLPDFKQALIPMSDNSIYAKLVSTISVALTNKGIKLHIPGILDIICPAYGAMRLYDGKKLEETSLEELQKKQKTIEPIITSNKPQFYKLKIGRQYIFTYTDKEGVNHLEYKDIKTPMDRNNLFEEFKKQKNASITENIVAGRDLASLDIEFSDGTNMYSLYDLDSVTNLFKIRDKENLTEERLFNIALSSFGMKPFLTKLEELNLVIPSNINVDNIYQYFKDNNIDINQLIDSDKLEKSIRRLVDHDMKVLSKAIHLDDTVQIHNKKVKVDLNTLNVIPYEVIMSKTFLHQFGLDYSDSVDKIANDPLFFTRKLLRKRNPLITNQNYFDIELKSPDGQHKYILDRRKLPDTSNFEELEIRKQYDDNGVLWRLDFSNKKMYKLYDKNDKVFKVGGAEIILTSNPLFYTKAIKSNDIIFSQNLSEEEIKSYIEEFAKSKSRNLNSIADEYEEYEDSYQRINAYKQQLTMLDANSLTPTNLENYKAENKTLKRLISYGNKMYSSWKKSLEIIASRTPAQSMQSVMPMLVIAYENSNSNYAFVSDAQLWLQGSDLDIDTVSLATYDVNNAGLITPYSPYFNYTSYESLTKSLQILPFPNGTPFQFSQSDTYGKEQIDQLLQYVAVDDSDNTKIISKWKNRYYFNRNAPLELLVKLLNEKEIIQPTETQSRTLKAQLKTKDVSDIFTVLKSIIDKHNLYFVKGNGDIESALQNYQMANVQDLLKDTANLKQSQQSVDAITAPFYKITEDIPESKIANYELPTDFTVKSTDIWRNMVGKDDVGISAAALKTFEALTFAYNEILKNRPQDADSLLFDKVIYDVNNQPKHYSLLANSFVQNVDNLSERLTKALQEVDQDTDAALVISALLGLSVDNAKELQMFKLNAGQSTLGLYLYGAMIGVPIQDLAHTIMSPVGRMISSIMNSNVFTKDKGQFSVTNALNYFEKSFYFLSKYNTSTYNKDTNKFEQGTPLNTVNNLIAAKKIPYKDEKVFTTLSDFLDAKNYNSSYKLRVIKEIDPKSSSLATRYRLKKLIQDSIQYINQKEIIKQHQFEYTNLKALASGSEEVRKLGTILSLNQGLKTKPEEIIKQIYDIENLVEGRFDIEQFVTDDKYKQEVIKNYKPDTFNILWIATQVPHFNEYLTKLGQLHALLRAGSARYRGTSDAILNGKVDLTGSDKLQKIKNTSKYFGDKLISMYFLQKGKTFAIPANLKYFTSNGNLDTNRAVERIQLGTHAGNATFKRFMDIYVFPRLKQGLVSQNSTVSTTVKTNKFIQSLQTTLFNLNVSKNPSIDWALGINMMPRTDEERLVFNSMKSEFNKLKTIMYTMPDGSTINLVNLIELYNMVAYSNRLGQSTLTAIFEDQKKSDILKEYNDFVAETDKTGDIPVNDDELNFYVTEFGSQYDQKGKHMIFSHKRDSFDTILMKKIPKNSSSPYDEDYDQNQGEVDDEDDAGPIRKNTIYSPINNEVDFNFFTKGLSSTGQESVTLEININNSKHQVIIKDNKLKTITYFDKDNKPKSINLTDEEGTIPYVFSPTGTSYDVKLIKSIVKNKVNPC